MKKSASQKESEHMLGKCNENEMKSFAKKKKKIFLDKCGIMRKITNILLRIHVKMIHRS